MMGGCTQNWNIRSKYPKYRNRKVKLDGFTFDSQKEANRYGELKLLERAGEISDLVIHPPFELQRKFTHRGETFRAIKFTADFQYKENGNIIVEDVKSPITKIERAYRIRVRLFLFIHPEVIFKEM